MMKSLIFAAFFVFLTAKALPQGQLIFANNAATAITILCAGPAPVTTQVGLYVGTVGDLSSLSIVGAATNCFLPGRFSGGLRTLPFTTGTVLLQVRAWLASTVYPTYEAAYAAGVGGDGSVTLGNSAPFSFTLTESPTPPVSIANAGLTPIYLFSWAMCVPEPSALALGSVGLMVAFVCFRRRK